MDGNEHPFPPAPEPGQVSDTVPAGHSLPPEGHQLPEVLPQPDATIPPAPPCAPPAAPANPVAAPAPRFNAGFKWFIFITLALLVVCGVSFTWYFLSHPETQGVSVVRMEGTMVTGESYDDEYIGSEVVGRELREAADDPLVDAIVLRVNSPGGTPAAAQEIIGDLEYAKTKKPVVVSMGDMGTSAAYYVSAHADRIYANPDTFTAGIGVIWKFSDISRWMEKEGYNVSTVKSGSKKDMGSTSRPLTSDEEEYARKVVSDSFETFISDITSQRVIARSDIEDGRVIRGADAIKINVIDELGNLNDAIEGAKKLAASRSKPSLPGLPS
ncbi:MULTISPECIES: signal peptide peptidase SppA [unclassified Methanoregula]|uniref:signal peptide peptidase SppA n=1 Tax=unclassified Methanoregula TaxID=2649730 RepID=UPI0009CDF096|nr:MULTISPECIES: signal peptide peptidase SppA [unclassified Methanoregula]OPX63922.1 MAG: protease 4 [Methanoregula sp. PtaB.Bin085]OPY35474.1 MAG: protease 4 [Methanoregula sp. PtaU1.Bin006]